MREELIIKTIEKGGLELHIGYDDSPINPRTEFDNLGTIVSKNGLGDKHEFNWNNYSSYKEYQKDIEKQRNVCVILPVYKFEHGNIALSTTDFNDRWDSCQIGFIYITKEKVREWFSVKRINKKLKDSIEKYLIEEIKTYGHYLNGDVYCYEIIDSENNHIGSCYGFYDMDYCEEYGMDDLNNNVKEMS